MDVRIGVAPMEAVVVETAVSVTASVKQVLCQVISPVVERVTPFSCPSIAGTSISAVSPDYTDIGGLALGIAA